MTKTLPELAGIDSIEGELNLEFIVKHLLDGLCVNPILPPDTWGAPLMRCLEILQASFGDSDNAKDQLAYDIANMAELFAGSGWRNLHASFAELMLLGHDNSERREWPSVDAEEMVEGWYGSGWWTPIAISGDWRLLTHNARGGTLIRLSYFDEGFHFNIWMLGYASAHEGDL